MKESFSLLLEKTERLSVTTCIHFQDPFHPLGKVITSFSRFLTLNASLVLTCLTHGPKFTDSLNIFLKQSRPLLAWWDTFKYHWSRAARCLPASCYWNATHKLKSTDKSEGQHTQIQADRLYLSCSRGLQRMSPSQSAIQHPPSHHSHQSRRLSETDKLLSRTYRHRHSGLYQK